MTLLAFKVDAPEGVATSEELSPVLPQGLAFLLSVAMVANFWWHHHRLLAWIEQIDAATAGPMAREQTRRIATIGSSRGR